MQEPADKPELLLQLRPAAIQVPARSRRRLQQPGRVYKPEAIQELLQIWQARAIQVAARSRRLQR